MQREHVISTAINSMGYNAATEVLEVEFEDGDVYQYFGVPPHFYEEMSLSSSKGEFFQDYIRASYPYRKIKN